MQKPPDTSIVWRFFFTRYDVMDDTARRTWLLYGSSFRSFLGETAGLRKIDTQQTQSWQGFVGISSDKIDN